MTISRHDPLREAISLRNVMDQLFSQSFVRPGWTAEAPEAMAPMNVYETDQGYHVCVALPGVKPEDIEVTVQQNTLSIRGEYMEEGLQSHMRGNGGGQARQGQPMQGQQMQGQPMQGQQMQGQQMQGQQQAHQRQGNWLMREMHTGMVQRSITFDRPVDVDHVETNYEYGVLHINLPVSQASRPRRLSIGGGRGQAQQIPTGSGQQQQQP